MYNMYNSERQLRIQVNGYWVDGGQILTVWQLDLRPDPSVNKTLKLSPCKKKGKGENSEHFTFIDDAKV